jgi:hypothetical protein
MTSLAKTMFPAKTIRQGRQWLHAAAAFKALGADSNGHFTQWPRLNGKVSVLAELGYQLRRGYLTPDEAKAFATEFENSECSTKEAASLFRRRRRELPPAVAEDLVCQVLTAVGEYQAGHSGADAEFLLQALQQAVLTLRDCMEAVREPGEE